MKPTLIGHCTLTGFSIDLKRPANPHTTTIYRMDYWEPVHHGTKIRALFSLEQTRKMCESIMVQIAADNGYRFGKVTSGRPHRMHEYIGTHNTLIDQERGEKVPDYFD